jgi:hypothetical protein
VLRVVLAGLLLTFLPAPLMALPITASVEGCVSTLASGEATWSSAEHFIFVSFWDPFAGCDPTIAHPGIYYTFEENFDGMGGLRTEAAPQTFPTCGRIQFDAQEYIDTPDGWLPLGQLKSLVFNTGIDCVSGRDPDDPPGDPSFRVPEPGTWMLFGLGAAGVARRYRTRAPASAVAARAFGRLRT